MSNNNNILLRSEISPEYSWDLTHLYINEDAYLKDFNDAEAIISHMADYQGKISKDPMSLFQYLEERDRWLLIIDRLYSYTFQYSDEDTTNTKAQAMKDQALGLYTRFASAISWEAPELLTLSSETLESWFEQMPLLEFYRHYLEDTLRQKAHTLSESEEALLSLSADMSFGPQSIFTMFNNADLTFPSIDDGDGNLVEVTHGRFISLMESKNRNVRKAAFEALYHTYENYKNTLAATYSANAKKELFYTKARKYNSTMEAHLDAHNIPTSVYTGLIDTVHEFLPSMYRYVALRKKLLGVDELHMYDVYTPIVEDHSPEYSFDQAKSIVDDLETFGLKAAAIKKIREFCGMMEKLCLRGQKEDAYAVAAALAMESGLLMFYKSDNSIEGQSRLANVEELLNSVKTYIEEKQNEYFEDMQAEGMVDEGVELTAADLPVVLLGDFLENVSLLSAVDVEDDENGSNKVTLMTVHSSKGLEFPYVFVAGMEENIFPSGGFLASESEIEEERRLFYVAMTRAKKHVHFSFASTRMRNGKHESNSPSRFIREVDPKYIANPLTKEDMEASREESFGGWGTRNSGGQSRFGGFGRNDYGRSGAVKTERSAPSGYRREMQRPEPSSVRRPEPSAARRTEPMPVRRPQTVPQRVPDADFEPTPILQLRAGQRIEHNRFGFGRILEITGTPADLKAKIAFDDHGEKILILKYAKIRIAKNPEN